MNVVCCSLDWRFWVKYFKQCIFEDWVGASGGSLLNSHISGEKFEYEKIIAIRGGKDYWGGMGMGVAE